jgi:hypothetical protein
MKAIRILGVMLLVAGCDCGDGSATDDPGDDPGDDTMDGSTTDEDGSTEPTDGFASNPDSPFMTDPETGCVLCPDGECCACDDGEDNDGDGFIDGLDGECTGGFDDDEDSYATGIPGDNVDFCQDCFFDGNSGQGDDDCAYHEDCLSTGSPPGMGGGDCFSCEVSDTCREFCGARTPNGCDCFGCCTVERDDGSTVDIFLADTCDLENLDDEEACPRCFKSEDCYNDCGECELCLGKTIEDLPESCYDDPDGGTPTYTCDNGEQVCDEATPCPTGYYCQTGCCLPTII